MMSMWFRTLTATALLAGLLLAGDLRIREDPFRPGEYRLTDEKGQPAGSIRQDPFREGEFLIEDGDGRRTGRLRQDAFREDELRIEKEP